MLHSQSTAEAGFELCPEVQAPPLKHHGRCEGSLAVTGSSSLGCTLSPHHASRAHFLGTFSLEPEGEGSPHFGSSIPLPEVGVGESCYLRHFQKLLDGG